MGKRETGFPRSAMSSEEAEETHNLGSLGIYLHCQAFPTRDSHGLEPCASIYGSSVISAKRGTRLPVLPLLQELTSLERFVMLQHPLANRGRCRPLETGLLQTTVRMQERLTHWHLKRAILVD